MPLPTTTKNKITSKSSQPKEKLPETTTPFIMINNITYVPTKTFSMVYTFSETEQKFVPAEGYMPPSQLSQPNNGYVRQTLKDPDTLCIVGTKGLSISHLGSLRYRYDHSFQLFTKKLPPQTDYTPSVGDTAYDVEGRTYVFVDDPTLPQDHEGKKQAFVLVEQFYTKNETSTEYTQDKNKDFLSSKDDIYIAIVSKVKNKSAQWLRKKGGDNLTNSWNHFYPEFACAYFDTSSARE